MKDQLIPDIRFEGYTEDWEQRKLGELGIVTTGKAFSSTEFDKNGKYLVITNKDISDSSRSKNTETDKITPRDKNIIEKFNLSGKNILVTMDGVNLGKTALYSNEDALLAQRVGRIQSSCLDFIFQLTINRTFLIKMQTLSVGNAIKHISLSQISNYSAMVPKTDEEQIKIGNFFKQLDETITLQERKLNLLKEQKKGYLQKMFPKKNEKFPELRFEGFTGDWEQRKLGELARFSKGNGYTKSDLIDSGTPIILYGSLYTNYQSSISKVKTYVELKEKSVISKGNEVIVPSSGESSEDISRASVVDTAGIILGGDLNIIKVTDLINPLFLALTISNGTQQKELSKRAQGKSVVHLNNSDLKSVNLIFPKTEEQTKIGNFFKQLDETITLQEQQLEKMKEMKKGFLQKLFI
ncbi:MULTISPECIES: restriction endonuclease subunit S [Vagococcus]|uniref:Type I restriction-modification system, specificity subunit S n=1 Tax=Vagococcus fluvialis bH819 TaxID=1255619 RepID=A0A1X6WJR3_9ENTE|nr:MULTISPECIES: restriction endonuclease subunit S [Vagococcus]SLM84531.1 Type I restriction-modification system, specificity subunit S [Vagococcus fluvialis bH819]HCM90005.1 restriction endonuclease subunit S [Vagococcus sp.]